MTDRKNIIFVLTVLYISIFSAVDGLCKTPAKAEKDSVISVIDRFAFRTNAFEWLLTVPNIGVEFDVSPSIYNKYTVGLNLKYNWNTWHNFSPSTVFNLFEVKPEFRKYWRYASKSPRDKGEKIGFKRWLREDVFSRERVNARPWRAWYLGAYANAGTYTLKLSETGRTGSYYGLGVTFGYGLPLYTYTKHSIDIEFGMSLGLMATQYNAFGHNPIGNYYTEKPSMAKGLHLVPYPMLSELRVAFVLRTMSIKEKYEKTDPKILAKRLERSVERDAKEAAKNQKIAEAQAAKEQKALDKANEQAKASKAKETKAKKSKKSKEAEE